MQHVAATIRLGADLNFTVRRGNLTVPEIVLLRLLHGDDAVVDIRPVGTSKRSFRAEKDRLMVIYGLKPETVAKINTMFANTTVQPLDTLADIGVDPRTKPEPKQSARVLTAEDVKPYDPSEDITPAAAEPENDDELTNPEPLPEIADDVPEPAADAEPALTPEETDRIMAEGELAAANAAPKRGRVRH